MTDREGTTYTVVWEPPIVLDLRECLISIEDTPPEPTRWQQLRWHIREILRLW